MGNDFNTLTDSGKEVCKYLGLDLPYSIGAKRDFICACQDAKGQVYQESHENKKTGKLAHPKKVKDPWCYMSTGKVTLGKFASKFKWVERLLLFKKSEKILKTYVIGIQEKMEYGIIRPSFLQHGTTSGRYSSRRPNFQNLPRDDKRVKACIIARPGNVFVGADYSQLEPRVFAAHSGDDALKECFKRGEDFYGTVGMPVFDITGCSLIKADKNFFGKIYPKLRDQSKIISLALPYGKVPHMLATELGVTVEEAREIAAEYWRQWPKVKKMMLRAHEQVKTHGVVYSLFGRPRRIPKAQLIKKLYGDLPHGELPYEARTLLNLAVNHEIQSTAASITNRAAIAFCSRRDELAKADKRWLEVKLIIQVHDELVAEGPKSLQEEMKALMKDVMENTSKLPGVDLIAEPAAAYNLADLK